MISRSLGEVEGTLLVETLVAHTDDVGSAVATPTVLRDMEETLTESLRLLLLVESELGVTVDRVLDGVLPGEASVLVDLADEHADAVGPLRPTGEELGHVLRGTRRDRTVLVVTIVQGLERVLQEEHLLLGIRLHDVVCPGEQVLDHGLLTDEEPVLELQSLTGHGDLVGRLLTGVHDADVTRTGDGVGHLANQGRLAGTRSAGDHRHRAGHAALAAESVFHPADADLVTLTELRGNVHLEDVRALLDALGLHCEIHRCHVCSVSLRV